MLRWLTLLLLLVHVASPARGKVPQGAPANPLPIRELEVEGVQSYRLGNGLRVLLLPEPSAASLTVEVAYSVGSRHEGYGEAGMAHLLEHLMFKGTARFPKRLSAEVASGTPRQRSITRATTKRTCRAKTTCGSRSRWKRIE